MRGVRRRLGLALVAAAVLLVPASFPSSHSAAADSASLSIVNYAFAPPVVTVPVGSTVTWTNKDDVAHTATSDSSTGMAWDSGSLNPGASYAVTFTVAGSFSYHCTIHPSMTGTIQVVSAPAATATPEPTAAATATSSTANPPAPPATSTPTTVPTDTPTATSPPPATAAPTSQGKTKAARKTISARPKGVTFIFNPVSTTVKVGTRVTWVNRSVAPHTVTSTTRGWTFNKNLNKRTVSFTFERAGTYRYHCIFHPSMVGKIVVKK